MARSFEPNGGPHDPAERQLEVARLGEMALETSDLEALMMEACQLLVSSLDMEYATVLEAVPSKGEAFPRASAGWEELGVSVPIGPASQAGYALALGEPVLVERLSKDERFGPADRLSYHDVASGITAPIGPPGDAWGVLEVHSSRPRTITRQEGAFVQNVAHVLASKIRTEKAEERTRMEEARGVLEASAENILDRVTDAFYALDDAYRFTRVNEHAEEVLQRSEEELLGRSLWEMFPEAKEIDEVWQAFETALNDQETTGYELYYPPLGAWVAARLYPSESGISVYFRDITERKEREQRLMESEARFRTLAENLDEVVWLTTDDPGDMLYVNPAVSDVFGLDPETMYEDPSTFLEAVHPEDRDRVEEAYFSMDEGHYEEEYRIVQGSGEVRWLKAHTAPVEDKEGGVRRIVGIAEDITARKKRERQLREEKEQFQALVTEVEEYSIILLDPQGRVQSWNAGASKILGYEEQEVLDESFARFYPPEEREAGIPDKHLEHAIQEGSLETEGWCMRGDGATFWASIVLTPLWDDEGELWGISKVVKDMTERRARERALAISEQRHRLLVENFPEGAVGMYDEDLRITLAGGTVLDGLGFRAEDLVGTTAWESYPRELIKAVEDDLLAVFQGGSRTFQIEYLGRHWLAHTHPVPSEAGGETMGMIVIQDITKRKRMEEDLRESQERYETLVENFPNGAVALVSPDLHYRIAGGSPVDTTIESAKEIEGVRVGDALSPDLADILLPRYEAAFQGEPSEFEQEHKGHHIQFRIVPVHDDGDVIAALGISQDITERREYQRQLEESNAHLEQFAAAASHDLQEPLRMVVTYLQLIEQRYGDTLDDEGREFLGYAVDGARRMRGMIQSLLAFSRITRAPPAMEPVDANSILEGVLDDLKMLIEETNADITSEDLPTVRADPAQLGQVFRNLLQNALTYRGDEPPRVHVGAEPVNEGWRFEITDQGVGIQPEYTEKVFDAFERIPHGEAPLGSGVGLSISRQVINRHGGTMGVESEPGEGSTFYFTLPGPSEPTG